MVFCCILVAALLRQTGGSRHFVDLQDGVAEGFVRGNVAVWLGIPFAQPPVGDLRWRPPQPPVSWRPHILNATAYRKMCVQANDYGRLGNMTSHPTRMNGTSEDCLYLNVFAWAHRQPSRPVPVFFWIHGGGFQGGSSSEWVFNGQHDVALMHGEFVMVTVNYRLNVFGFAASERLRSRDPSGGTGNYGLLDQRLAMRWVQNNIAAFGGDPSRVLIVGESAGADSVAHHLVMPKSWGLFNAAGVDSGALYSLHPMPNRNPATNLSITLGPTPGNVTVKHQEARFDLLLMAAGCGEAMVKDPVACLVALPEGKVLELMFAAEPWRRWQWVPVIDAVELSDAALTLAATGKLAPVPVVVGSNAEDIGATLPNCLPQSCSEDHFRALIEEQFTLGSDAIEQVVRAYAREAPRLALGWNKWFSAEVHMGADQIMTCASRRLARWVTAAGQHAYWYYFAYPPRLKNGTSVPIFHAYDLAYLFHAPANMSHIDSDGSFSANIVQYWANFAKTGEPQGAQQWPAYDPLTEPALVFGEAQRIEVVERLRGDRCDFWDKHGDHWGGEPPEHDRTEGAELILT